MIPSTTPDTVSGWRRPPLAQRLREETAALHRALEQQLDVRQSRLSIQRYRWLLQTFFGFYAPLEAALASRMPAGAHLPFPLLDRTSRIERDLVALGMPPARVAMLPRCSNLPRLSRHEHVAGCLYVIEGAALGGQIIARHAQERFGLSKDSGCAFFVGEGKATADRWGLVLQWLGQLERTRSDRNEVVAAACDTFGTLGHWAERLGPAPQ